MQHVISVAFDFDDETVKKKLEQRMANEMYSDIQRGLMNDAKSRLGLNGTWNDKDDWIRILSPAIEDFFEQNSDEIIAAIAERVSRAQIRRKANREKLEEACDASD